MCKLLKQSSTKETINTVTIITHMIHTVTSVADYTSAQCGFAAEITFLAHIDSLQLRFPICHM